MAIISSQTTTTLPIADNASDYGSDIDDATAFELLSQAESQRLKSTVLESIEPPNLQDEGAEKPVDLRLPRLQHSPDSPPQSNTKFNTVVSPRRIREASVEIEYDEGNRTTFSPSNREDRKDARSESVEPVKNDARSPLERFRKRRPLSVTDLVSPAWCEQQYEYSLSRYGRVRKTAAMKQGSSVHKELEDQVHVHVPIEVVSAEDRFGLRIWNTIQGLRTLRETGLTRELEIWGVLEGEVVIGIIDELSTTCPDENMVAAIRDEAKSGGKKTGRQRSEQLSPDQRTLTDFLTSSQNGGVLENNPAFLGTLHESPPTYYLVDIKTRQSKTLPGPGSQSRPTHMQLMIYHRLLSSLAANEVPADRVFERYSLQPHARFSDTFIAEIANLDIAALASFSAEEDVSPKTTQREDSLTELLEHNTISSLWTLLVAECARTLPTYLSQSSISPLLTAEFRSGRTTYADAEETEVLQKAGTLIGRRSFAYEPAKVERYVSNEVRWWKGERETVGVEVEEAYKCRMCEFADGCTWRAIKVEEGLRKAKLRGEERRRSEI